MVDAVTDKVQGKHVSEHLWVSCRNHSFNNCYQLHLSPSYWILPTNSCSKGFGCLTALLTAITKYVVEKLSTCAMQCRRPFSC